MEYEESVLVRRADDVKPGHGREMSLHCAQCNTVLGDSSGICGQMDIMDSIMCLKVTSDVVVGDAVESGHKGEMANCIFSSLRCRACRSAVGKVIHSAPSHLASIRSLFLLHKANMACYILDSRSMVKASTLSFDLKPLRRDIHEVKQQFKAHLDQMLHVKNKLIDCSVTSQLN